VSHGYYELPGLEEEAERFIPKGLVHKAMRNIIFLFSEAPKSFTGQFFI
jgi:hypothetical protein